MNSLYLLTILVVAGILVAVSGKEPPATALRAFGRLLRAMLVIGLGELAYVMVAQTTGQYGYATLSPQRDLTVLTLAGYLYAYRRQRPLSLRMVLSTAWLAAAAAALWFVPAREANMGCAFLMPLLLPLLRRIDFAPVRTPAGAAPKKAAATAPSHRIGPEHYRSPNFEIRVEPDGESLYVRFQGDDSTRSPNELRHFDGVFPLVQDVIVGRTMFDCKLQCSVWYVANKEIVTRSGQKTNSTYIPGSVSSGWSSSGEYVSMNTPGQYVNTPGETFTYEQATGNYIVRIMLVPEIHTETILVGTLSSQDHEDLKQTIAAIRARALPLVEARTAAQKLADEENARQRTAARAAALQADLDKYRSAAGFEEAVEHFSTYRQDHDGHIIELLAADRTGRGIIVTGSGKEMWAGSLRGAQAAPDGEQLGIMVVDEAYRQANLKERRYTLALASQSLRREWADRIALLSA